MSTHAIVFAASALMLLCACDPITSVSRTATVGRLPSRKAVASALRDVPGMRHVELRATDATSSFSLYEGVVRDPAFDQFLYEGASVSGVVEVREDGKGVKTLRLYHGWMGPRPPKRVFEETRSFMDVVYDGLRRRLPELPPSSGVREEIIRPPLR